MRLLLVPCLAFLLPVASPLRICAFNIQSFGDSKLSDEGTSEVIVKVSTWGRERWGPVVERGRLPREEGAHGRGIACGLPENGGQCWGPTHGTTFGALAECCGGRGDERQACPDLVPRGVCSWQILSQYDIALVQEVRDSDLSAVSELLERLNSASKHKYAFEISQSLGRENYKEKYLFLYRCWHPSPPQTTRSAPGRLPGSDRGRPPPPAAAPTGDRRPGAEEAELVLIPLHAVPGEAVAEIDALYDVYLAVIDKWGTDNMMFLGDFNADCSYVGKKDWAAIRLRASEVFHWLIPDSADTTVGKSDCAYDRIVVSGSKLRKWIKPNSATVFDFQRAFKLNQEEVIARSLALSLSLSLSHTHTHTPTHHV
uniref:Deoxyribonuclease 1 like 2 n=1 Tax=Varanus komodoensis TaxID=61221 RepID=A0A8D2JJN3_VARKO